MIKLISFKSNEEKSTIVFNISHNNGKTTVEQNLMLEKINCHNGWVASIAMDGFPRQDTPTEAAHKLADWMERLSETIKGGFFDSINFNELNSTQFCRGIKDLSGEIKFEDDWEDNLA